MAYSGVARVSCRPEWILNYPQKFLTTFFGDSLFFAHLRLFCNPFLKFLPFKILSPFSNFLGITSVLPPGADRPYCPTPLLRHWWPIIFTRCIIRIHFSYTKYARLYLVYSLIEAEWKCCIIMTLSFFNISHGFNFNPLHFEIKCVQPKILEFNGERYK